MVLRVLRLTRRGMSTHLNTAALSAKDREDVAGWIERASTGGMEGEENIKELDAYLKPRTFVVGNTLTAADIALYRALHPTISKARPEQYYAHPALTRYFDHIQTCVRDSDTDPLPTVEFNLEAAPKLERGQRDVKKEKKEKTDSVQKAEKIKEVAKNGEGQEGKKQKEKERKGKSEKAKETDTEKGTAVLEVKKGKSGKVADEKKTKAPASVANENAAPVPSMIDLRVGKIVDVKKHPDADSLYVEQIDLGEESGPRTVVSGLVNYIPIEQMRDRRLVAVCNLKPATMRGVKSFAMVLCATSKGGREGGIEIVDPPLDAKVGERVYFEGVYENDTPLEQLNPKKKIFETIQPGFTTLDTREAAWVDPVSQSVHRIRTKSGVCTAPSFVGATLS